MNYPTTTRVVTSNGTVWSVTTYPDGSVRKVLSR